MSIISNGVPDYGGTSTAEMASINRSDSMNNELGYDCRGGALTGEQCRECCPTIYGSNTYQQCQNVKLKTRVIITILLVTIMSVTSALIMRFMVLGPIVILTPAGEMRPFTGVNDGFDNQLCSALHIQTEQGSTFDGYVFKQNPPLSDHREVYVTTKKGTVNNSEYVHWAFYLIDTSEVKVQTCTDDVQVELWVIKGRSNWNKWLMSSSCLSCYMYKRTYQPCAGKSNDYHLTISSSDEYYFAFVNRESHQRMTLTATFTLNRAFYDTSAAHACVLNTSSTRLPIGIGDIPVVHMSPTHTLDNEEIKSECVPNILMYTVYFLFVPVAGMFVISAIVWVLIKIQMSIIRDFNDADRQRRYQTMSTVGTESTSISRRPFTNLVGFPRPPQLFAEFSNDSPPDYHTVAFEGNGEEQPPSYDEVQAQKSVT